MSLRPVGDGSNFCFVVNLKAVPKMLSMVPSVFTGMEIRDIETIKEITRQAYPAVPHVSTQSLAEWMEQPGQSLLLIDVRSPEEFAVSHLRNAINAHTPAQIAHAIHNRRGAGAILYCSVGFRSSRLAHALAEQGLAGIANLEGSIFQWANEGRALFKNGGPATHVHPYAKRWAGLLKPGLAAELNEHGD